MKLIAVEEHFGLPEISAAGAEALRRDCPQFHATYLERMGLPHVPAPGSMQDLGAGRIADMDVNGIDVQILSSNSTQLIEAPDAADLCRAANDALAHAVRAYPTRLAGFAALPTADPEAAARELERTVRDYGFKGANLFGRTGGDFLDHPRFEPLLAAAETLGVPLYLHPGVPPAAVSRACYDGFSSIVSTRLACSAWGWHADCGVGLIRLILSGALDRHPCLQIVAGHWGEMVPFYLARLDEALPQTLTNLRQPLSSYFQSNLYVTPSGMFQLPQLQFVLSVLGADRILFSVDYPFLPNTGARAFLERAPIPQEVQEKIAHGNAERLFRW